nr:hypothetical protein MmNV_54 [Menippe mercenaria nudivirus]
MSVMELVMCIIFAFIIILIVYMVYKSARVTTPSTDPPTTTTDTIEAITGRETIPEWIPTDTIEATTGRETIPEWIPNDKEDDLDFKHTKDHAKHKQWTRENDRNFIDENGEKEHDDDKYTDDHGRYTRDHDRHTGDCDTPTENDNNDNDDIGNGAHTKDYISPNSRRVSFAEIALNTDSENPTSWIPTDEYYDAKNEILKTVNDEAFNEDNVNVPIPNSRYDSLILGAEEMSLFELPKDVTFGSRKKGSSKNKNKK